MAKLRISWSTEAWHFQDVEASSYSEAADIVWNPDGERTTYQENLNDKWFQVECIEEEESMCPDDDREDMT